MLTQKKAFIQADQYTGTIQATYVMLVQTQLRIWTMFWNIYYSALYDRILGV